MITKQKINAQVTPEGSMRLLSKAEVLKLADASHGGLYDLFRRCSLAVLNSGSRTDDSQKILRDYKDFAIKAIQKDRGILLEIDNAPDSAFVDGEMIRGLKEHLFSVLRDIVYVHDLIYQNPGFSLDSSSGITEAVFHILRNANILQTQKYPNLVVCWGGHSISREEYDYTKEVGYQLGLRGLDVGTGCGPGAMKGPMKGATIGHSKQRYRHCHYIGFTEPGIIAAEPPNAIVNDLVILPDIEKRLEAFVRTGHGIIVFPGGVGTAEEILYLIGILMHPNNKDMEFPLIFTGPKNSADYFEQINEFIRTTLGEEALGLYQIIINDPAKVAQEMKRGIQRVKGFRYQQNDSYHFNWLLHIDLSFQQPFPVDHANVRNLQLDRQQPAHQLAANLRRAFSAIVSGNVKDTGIRLIEEQGPFELKGDRAIIRPLEALLEAFVKQQRMKLPGSTYVPCYRIL